MEPKKFINRNENLVDEQDNDVEEILTYEGLDGDEEIYTVEGVE